MVLGPLLTPQMQCYIFFQDLTKPLIFPNADYFLCISGVPAKYQNGWKKILQSMGKQEEKQNGGTLSPQAVSCLLSKGTQWLHIVQLL